eukprot:6172128-Pleurochrysis_carterae.AAC.2
MGVRAMAPPCTESSIHTCPEGYQSGNATTCVQLHVSPHSVGAMRPVVPDGQVALHYTHFVIFAQRKHPTNHTLDDHVWAATFEENWGVDVWPALFTLAGEPELSTMTHLREAADPHQRLAEHGVRRLPYVAGREPSRGDLSCFANGWL